MADLGGKTVAIPFWYSIHNVVLQDLLKKNGLTPVTKAGAAPGPKEVNLVVMAPSDMPPAIASKQIAGYIVAEPFNAAAEALGIGKVLRFYRRRLEEPRMLRGVHARARPRTAPGLVAESSERAGQGAALDARTSRRRGTASVERRGQPLHAAFGGGVETRIGARRECSRILCRVGCHQASEWNQARIDFQPYPYPSYAEELVKRLKTTLVEGDHAFLDQLDPAAAARELIDDRFVKAALKAHGGLAAFGLPEQFDRREIIAA